MENLNQLVSTTLVGFYSPEGTIETPSLTNDTKNLLLNLNHKSTNKKKEMRFMAIVRQKNDITGLLEAMFIALLLKKRDESTHTSILVHTDNQYLVKATEVFNTIYSSKQGNKINKVIHMDKATSVYIPQHDIYAQFISSFSVTRLRTTGLSQGFISRILGMQHIEKNNNTEIILNQKDFPRLEKALPRIHKRIPIPDLFLPKENFIWLSLFEEHNLNRDWPIEYTARLIRMLYKLGLSVVIPLPHFSKGHEQELDTLKQHVKFLKSNLTEGLYFINEPAPEIRAAGMQRALAVVGSSGPEIILASILNKPMVVLHDMRSHKFKSHTDGIFHTFKKRQGRELAGSNPLVKKVSMVADLTAINQMELTRYMHAPVTQTQKHLTPIVDKCIEDCDACEYNSCVEYISPEQVFESLKKIIFPN